MWRGPSGPRKLSKARPSLLNQVVISIVAERDQRIYFRGPPRGNEASRRGDHAEQHYDAQERNWVKAAYLEQLQLAAEQARHTKTGENPDAYSHPDKLSARAEDQAQNLARLGAQGHAQANLARAHRDEVGEDAEDAGHRQR